MFLGNRTRLKISFFFLLLNGLFFHFSFLYVNFLFAMENDKNSWTLAVVFALFASSQWIAAIQVGFSFKKGSGPSPGPEEGVTISGYTLQRHFHHHDDLSGHYIPHNDIHLQKKKGIHTMLQNRKKDGYRDIDLFTKRVLESIAKRASYANSEEEVKRWQDKNNEDDLVHLKENVEEGSLRVVKDKRSDLQEYHAGGCVAKIDWKQFDGNHFPRFLKSYNCTSATCNRNFGECHPKTYIIKVLKRNSALAADENCDAMLPEELRCTWKLEPKNVTTYCECRSNQPLTLYGR